MSWYEALDQWTADYLPDITYEHDAPLSRHTSFRIGGPARRMAFPKDGSQMVLLIEAARTCGARPLVIGNGTNLLFPDEGVDRLVVNTRDMSGVTLDAEGRVAAEAGASLSRVAVFAQQHGLAGLEFAHGIPGTVGGGVFMNAGAYDGEMAQVIDWVDCLDETGAAHRLGKDELKLGYRTSVFSQLPWSIVGAHLTLTMGDETAIREKMADLAQRRRSKQPLEYPSAGSTFKRPVGHFAGGLIEQCGLKGTKVGGAQVSEKHAGFVINAGGATCRDILALIRLVRATVLEQTGVTLEPEVRLLGCALDEES